MQVGDASLKLRIAAILTEGCMPSGPPVHHFDLYRLEVDSNLERLDLHTSFQSAVSLVEWADRLGNYTPAEHLSMSVDLLQPVRLLSSRYLPIELDEAHPLHKSKGDLICLDCSI